MNSRVIDKTSQGQPLSALQDVPDLRDLPFQPSLTQLKKELQPPSKLKILDQQKEAACTGFGLAAIINLLNQKRGNKTPVSPRMLYEMAKLHDEWPGEYYAGSSCRGAIKGWFNMGVCRDSKWKYAENKPESLTIDRAFDARKNTIGAYYRVQPRISDFHAALNEAGAIFCSANIHAGWEQPAKTTGLIPFDEKIRGGHAFAIVGYNKNGFWVQNSWGRKWGKAGLGLWQYEDWHENIMDAWVFNLALATPQIWHLPDQGEKNRSGLSFKPSPPRSEIAGHFIHVDDGRFHKQGRYWSNAEDVRITAGEIIKQKKRFKHLLLYAHGGLNSPKDSARRIAAMKKTFKANGIYPYHFMYDTGIAEELGDVIFRRKKRAEERVGGFSDWTDKLLEWAARIPGRALWREMKSGASQPFSPAGAGTEALKIFLGEFSSAGDGAPSIHIAGHSTGGILQAHLLEAMEEMAPDLRIKSCSLLAPACSVDLFRSHYYPYLASDKNSFGIDQMRIYNLNKRLEKDDQVGQVYRKSLLYLVSRAFEEATPEAILGMKKYSDELMLEPAMIGLGDRLEIYYSNGRSSEKGTQSQSETHGGFDNDVDTMNSLLKTILGKKPVVPFTKKSLDYCITD